MKVRRQYQTKGDIAVLLDTTGSIGCCRDKIVDHICGFADDLSRLQHDLRIALLAFRPLFFNLSRSISDISMPRTPIGSVHRNGSRRVSAATRVMPGLARDR